MVINKTTEKILACFLADPTKDYNISELAKAIRVNYRLVYQEILQLEKQNILSIKRKGGMNNCMINLNTTPPLYAFIEHLRKEAFSLKHPFVKVITKELKKITTTFSVIILFGSFAQGKERKNSDIDLLLIVPNTMNLEKFKKEIYLAFQSLSYPFDINVVQEQSFLEMKQQQGLNIVHELISNHIIIYGAEAYYELLSR